MTTRQKILLHILNQSKKPTPIDCLMAWLFLLKKETHMPKSFYDFVPHEKGPFSFLAAKEIESLRKIQLIDASSLSISRLEKAQDVSNSILQKDKKTIHEVLKKYNSLSKIKSYIQEKYSWYVAINQKKETKATSSKHNNAIYTTGYEHESIDYFLNKLLKNHIKNLIDVRKNAFSHKYGFSKSELQKFCEVVGINYYHFEELGIPSSLRNELKIHDDHKTLFKIYKEKILNHNLEKQKEVLCIIEKMPSVLMCFEYDPAFCHRSILAKSLSHMSGISIQNLFSGKLEKKLESEENSELI